MCSGYVSCLISSSVSPSRKYSKWWGGGLEPGLVAGYRDAVPLMPGCVMQVTRPLDHSAISTLMPPLSALSSELIFLSNGDGVKGRGRVGVREERECVE